ncbi:MAG: YbgC/FadM family acyl-CoA thioesterase [Pseudomonadota bacterium]|nr:YbgC/FadM family acyl-CoA thioesterase [Pseudomonadota bacterium]
MSAQGAAAFEWPIRVYWEDTDAGGIVFYANYLKFFERARTEWLRALGLHQSALREGTDGAPGGMFVVAAAQLRYLRPARLDDELIVTARLQTPGRTALHIAQQAFLHTARGPSRELLCEGSIRVGWVQADTLKPARIPPAIVEKLHP